MILSPGTCSQANKTRVTPRCGATPEVRRALGTIAEGARARFLASTWASVPASRRLHRRERGGGDRRCRSADAGVAVAGRLLRLDLGDLHILGPLGALFPILL